MTVATKVTEGKQTQVPAELRHRFGVEPGDLVVWEETPEGEVRVRFRKPKRLRDIAGTAPGASQGDAVETKKRAQQGDL